MPEIGNWWYNSHVNRNFSEPKIYSNSDIELRFLFPNQNKLEKVLTTRTPDAFDFLSVYSPNRIGMLRRIMSKVEFKFPRPLKVDLRMPMFAAGYYALEEKYIAISPMFLMSATEEEIAHVLIHEGIHAGIYTGGVEVRDEVLTETMAKKKMGEVYGDEDAFISGYQGMVDEMHEFFGEMSYEEMAESIENGDEKTFDNILELIVVRPLLKSELPENLKWQKIEKELYKKWDMIKRLFPRILNSIEGRFTGPHEEARMHVFSYKLEGLMEKVAGKFLEDNYKVLADIFLTSMDRKEPEFVTSEYLTEKLWEKGYGYLLDFGKEKMDNLVNLFLAEYNVLKKIHPLKQRKTFLNRLKFSLDFV